MSEGERRAWVVVGTSTGSGELMTMTIESVSAERAAATAQRHGIIATSVKPADAIEYATPAQPVPSDWIICPNPNCGYRGQAVRSDRGSTVVLLLLLLVGIIPGIIYAVAFSGEDFCCPQCGIKAR